MIKSVGSIETMKQPYIYQQRDMIGNDFQNFLIHIQILNKHIDLHKITPFHYAAKFE